MTWKKDFFIIFTANLFAYCTMYWIWAIYLLLKIGGK